MSTTQLTCEELVELVTEYLEGGMSPAERARFEEHLEQCDGCVAFVEQMRVTIAVVGSVSADDITPAMRERLLEAFAGWRDTE